MLSLCSSHYHFPFKVEGQEGMSFTKLGQIPIGFGHLGFHDFYHFIAYWDILNMSRFKVGGVFEAGT